MELPAKLQLREGQGVEVLQAPPSLPGDLTGVEPASDDDAATALLVYVTNAAALERQRTTIVESASRNRLTWVAYPKSGQLDTDLNRDVLAALLSSSGVQPVRQIAIDDVWSALRFRPA